MYTMYDVANGEEDGGVVVYVSVAVEGAERKNRRMQFVFTFLLFGLTQRKHYSRLILGLL